MNAAVLLRWAEARLRLRDLMWAQRAASVGAWLRVQRATAP